MCDESVPGAALEAPETFQGLAAPLWPRLSVALGYTGGARWVAFYLSADKARYADGASSGGSDTGLFLAYRRHRKIAPHLAGARLGSADEEARDWLVADTHHHLWYLAPSEPARRFLCLQWPSSEGLPLEYTEAELARLEEAWHEVAAPPDWHERLAEALRESRANYRLMQQWLDQHE
jgi:hypothetical protein